MSPSRSQPPLQQPPPYEPVEIGRKSGRCRPSDCGPIDQAEFILSLCFQSVNQPVS
jgi:hypothetical protein